MFFFVPYQLINVVPLPVCLLFRFDFCNTFKSDPPVENLGQVVFGERLDSSDYRVSPLVVLLCMLSNARNSILKTVIYILCMRNCHVLLIQN